MFKELKECLCCGEEINTRFLDLGKQPPANSFHWNGEVLPEYPLALNLCRKCYHVQLTVAVDRDELYKHYDYVSGTSNTLMKYFDVFVEYCDQFNAQKVLEIACNDGSLLAKFKNQQYDVVGVDPAENIYKISRAKGLNIYCEYWNADLAKKLYPQDLIVAQNVFAHVDDPLQFLLDCKTALAKEGKILIQTSQAKMFSNGEYDTTYHEHISFFSVRSMFALVHSAGLYLNRVSFMPIHGSSYLFEISGDEDESAAIETMVEEQKVGRYRFEHYFWFKVKAEKSVSDLKEYLRHEPRRLVGYGAAAKGNTFLNFSGVKPEFIVDESPLKIGKLTPGTNIEVRGLDALKCEEDLCVLVLAWNFLDEIKARVKKLRPQNEDTFVACFPKFDVSK